MTAFTYMPDWTINSRTEANGEYRVEGTYDVEPKACTDCGTIGQLYKHGVRPQVIRDAPLWGKALAVTVQRQRYKCRACQVTFLQPLPDVADGRRGQEKGCGDMPELFRRENLSAGFSGRLRGLRRRHRTGGVAMNKERIKQIARECGFRIDSGGIYVFSASDPTTYCDEEVVQFAQAIRNEALEEAARECQNISGNEPSGHGGRFGALDCAAAIRRLKV